MPLCLIGGSWMISGRTARYAMASPALTFCGVPLLTFRWDLPKKPNRYLWLGSFARPGVEVVTPPNRPPAC